MSSFESVCSYPSLTFEWVCFFLVNVLVLCRFGILALCQMARLQIFLSHSVCCQFTLISVSFAVQKLFTLIRSHMSILAFIAIAFGVLVMKSFLMPMSCMDCLDFLLEFLWY